MSNGTSKSFLIRSLSPELRSFLKARARRNGSSMHAESIAILEEARVREHSQALSVPALDNVSTPALEKALQRIF